MAGSSRRYTQVTFRFKLFGKNYLMRPPSLKFLGRTLLLSLPAILGVLFASSQAAGLFTESALDAKAKYRVVAAASTFDKPAGEMVFKRVLSVDPNDIEVWLKYVEMFEARKQPFKSKLLLSDLVEARELRDARLYTKFAEFLMLEEPTSAASVIKAEKLLRLVATSDNPVESVLARRKLSLLYLSMNNRETAYRILEPVMIDFPVAGSEALWIEWTGGKKLDKDQLGRVMTRLDSYLLNQVSSVPYETALAKTRMFIMQGQEKEARDWLKAQPGLSDSIIDKLNRELEEMTMVASIVTSVDSKTPDWPKLEALLKRDPEHPVWTQIAATLWSEPNKVGATPAKNWVQQQLDDGSASLNLLKRATILSAQIFNAKGTRAEDSLPVRQLYRKLLKRDPDNYIALNNLAMLIYKYEPDHLAEGLAYAQRANELIPNAPEIQETIGQLLVRMGRIDDAQTILERCVDKLPMEWNMHNTLAQIYDLKGMMEKAEAHRLVMSKLKKPPDAANYEKLNLTSQGQSKSQPEKSS
jgi:tetratricopeptide (TPR) repeat protein